MSTSPYNRINPPALYSTAPGYKYFRCRANGDDSTVYVHQLCAIAGGADPHDVFSDSFDVHHRPLCEVFDLQTRTPQGPFEWAEIDVPPVDTPESVELQPRWEHREKNLSRGGADD